MRLKHGLRSRLWVGVLVLLAGSAAQGSNFWGPQAIGKNFQAPLEVVFRATEQVLVENGEKIAGATPDWQLITTEPRYLEEKSAFFGKKEEYTVTFRFRHAENEIRVTALCSRTKRGKVLGLFKRNRQIDSDGQYESFLLGELGRKVQAWIQESQRSRRQVAPRPAANAPARANAPPAVQPAAPPPVGRPPR
jgi:hypothetical protein